MTRAEAESGVRITQQFRSGEAMVYDLRDERANRLSLRVSGRGGADSGPPTEWRIEASTTTRAGSAVVEAWATTRAEALRAVGRAWSEKRSDDSLPQFDWELVARAMIGVRAL